MAFFDDDATLLLAGENIITGRPAIRAALEARYPAGTTFAMSRTLAGGEVSADGDFGFTFGWYNLSATPAGGAAVVTYGTYISVWQREGGRPTVVAYFTRSYPTTHGAPRAGFPLLADAAGVEGARHPGSLRHQRESLMAVDSEFAAVSVDQGFSIAFPAYAGDLLLLTGGKDHYYLEGSAEIVDWYAGWTPAEVLAWKPVIAGASHSGDLGYTIGTATDSYTSPDGTVDVAYSKYITLWLRQADGSWRFIGDAGAASPAPAN
jgi:ketosteroid isomerase-like protein